MFKFSQNFKSKIYCFDACEKNKVVQVQTHCEEKKFQHFEYWLQFRKISKAKLIVLMLVKKQSSFMVKYTAKKLEKTLSIVYNFAKFQKQNLLFFMLVKKQRN